MTTPCCKMISFQHRISPQLYYIPFKQLLTISLWQSVATAVAPVDAPTAPLPPVPKFPELPIEKPVLKCTHLSFKLQGIQATKNLFINHEVVPLKA